jgi:hypothetical protein
MKKRKRKKKKRNRYNVYIWVYCQPSLVIVNLVRQGLQGSLLSHGGHLGYRTALTDTILKGDHPRIISAKFGWDWHSSFRGEDFFKFQNCSILSQKVPKCELYKHNDELFNIYYGIFYELWTFAYFDRLCKLEKRGDEILKKSSPLKVVSEEKNFF